MLDRQARRGATRLVATCLALVSPLDLAAQEREGDPVEPLSQQIDDSRRRLEQIRTEQRRLNVEMRELTSRAHDLSDELVTINKQIENQELLVRELDNQLAITDRNVTTLTADLLRTMDELVEKRALFARRARDLYKRGPLANAQVLLSARSFSDLINRYQYLYLVALHDRLFVRQIEDLRDKLEEQQAELYREVGSLRDIRNDKVHELQQSYSLEQQRGRRLSAFRGMRATTARKLDELVRDEEQLTGLIDRLEREREAAAALAAGLPTRGTLGPEIKGTLDWPVTGRVIYTFGKERTDQGTTILRKGVGIAAAEGAPIKAVASGTVVFAEPWFGYGPSVIISHGAGYYSLYLYLSEMSVAQGQGVQSGAVVGTVGGAGTPEGAHFELQIWEARNAVDPIPWLRKSRG